MVVQGFQPRWIAALPGSSELRCNSPGSGRPVDRPLLDTRIAGHGGVKVVDAGLDAGADVAQQAAPPLSGSRKGIDHVVDVDKIAGLLPVAEDQAGFT